MSLYRKVIHMSAEDHPNVRLARAQIASGMTPTGEELIPGGMTWNKLLNARANWDDMEQAIGLDGRFYEGPQLRLFPREWLTRAQCHAMMLKDKSGKSIVRKAKGMGCDPGEGGDATAWCVTDEIGIMHLEAVKTPDTTVVTATTLRLMREYGIPAERVVFDRGGGGKEHADRLRLQGHAVRTVAFGEGVVLEPKRGMRLFGEKVENREEKYAYVNRRAQMYHEASLILDPHGGVESDDGIKVGGPLGYGIPAKGDCYEELCRQLSLMPKLTDPEGRYRMLSKHKRITGMPDPANDQDQDTLVGILGRSPDEADAFVTAIYAMLHKQQRGHAGALA